MIQIAFPGFSGTPEALREALRRGRVSPKAVPVLKVIEDTLAQLPPSLKERSEVLPILAELLVLKLAPERAMEAEEGKEASLVQALLDLSETVAFLEGRFRARAGLLPVAPPPLPRSSPRLSPKALWQAARPFRRAVLALPQEGFGLKEAWERLRGLLRGRVVFQALPLGGWGERVVAFAALLEAHRLGLLRLHQEAPFASLHVEVLEERRELSA